MSVNLCCCYANIHVLFGIHNFQSICYRESVDDGVDGVDVSITRGCKLIGDCDAEAMNDNLESNCNTEAGTETCVNCHYFEEPWHLCNKPG